MPRIGIGIHDKNDGITFGRSIGYGADSWGSIAFDMMFMGDGQSFMLVYEKVLRRLSLKIMVAEIAFPNQCLLLKIAIQ